MIIRGASTQIEFDSLSFTNFLDVLVQEVRLIDCHVRYAREVVEVVAVFFPTDLSVQKIHTKSAHSERYLYFIVVYLIIIRAQNCDASLFRVWVGQVNYVLLVYGVLVLLFTSHKLNYLPILAEKLPWGKEVLLGNVLRQSRYIN